MKVHAGPGLLKYSKNASVVYVLLGYEVVDGRVKWILCFVFFGVIRDVSHEVEWKEKIPRQYWSRPNMECAGAEQ